MHHSCGGSWAHWLVRDDGRWRGGRCCMVVLRLRNWERKGWVCASNHGFNLGWSVLTMTFLAQCCCISPGCFLSFFNLGWLVSISAWTQSCEFGYINLGSFWVFFSNTTQHFGRMSWVSSWAKTHFDSSITTLRTLTHGYSKIGDVFVLYMLRVKREKSDVMKSMSLSYIVETDI